MVLLDLHLPDMSGAEVIRRLLAADPEIRIVVLSASGERQDVLDAMTAGATGYLVKSAQFSEMLEAVQAAAAGKAVFTPGLAGTKELRVQITGGPWNVGGVSPTVTITVNGVAPVTSRVSSRQQ